MIDEADKLIGKHETYAFIKKLKNYKTQLLAFSATFSQQTIKNLESIFQCEKVILDEQLCKKIKLDVMDNIYQFKISCNKAYDDKILVLNQIFKNIRFN